MLNKYDKYLRRNFPLENALRRKRRIVTRQIARVNKIYLHNIRILFALNSKVFVAINSMVTFQASSSIYELVGSWLLHWMGFDGV